MNIELRDLTLEFDNLRALDGLSARIEGDIIGLLGANGSGKTSVLGILAGVVSPTRGAALIDGRQVMPGRQAWISYLPQETGFFPFLQHPARTLSLSLAFRGILDPEAPRHILEALGLADEDRSAEGFSGGMKQKLRIAQALVHSPKLLLLDEPTTGLDARERFRVLRLIGRLRGRVAIVFSTHDPFDAAAVCDTLLVLHRGRLVTTGTPSELMRFAEGRVFEVMARSETLPELNEGEVIKAERVGDGFRLRVLGTPSSAGRRVEPTLEDAYLFLTRSGSDGRTSAG